MKYYLTDKDAARKAGFTMEGRVCTGGRVWLNGKELMTCAALHGTLEERAAQLGAKEYTRTEALYQIRNAKQRKGGK